MLLVGRQKGIQPVETEWWGAGVVICLERGADLHTAQLMPLPLTVSCFSKIQIGFTFLVPAHMGSPGQTAVKHVCVSLLTGARRLCPQKQQQQHRGAGHCRQCAAALPLCPDKRRCRL